MPKLEPYNGIIDPLDHQKSNKDLMMIQGTTNALLCLFFLTTLWKVARVWYSGLELKSINFFKQLEK